MKTLFFLSLFFASTASADILFIDTNNSPEEIATAQKAAKTRGEALIVVPSRTADQQKNLDAIHKLEIQKMEIRSGSYDAFRMMDAYRTELNKEKGQIKPDPKHIQHLTDLVTEYAKKMHDADQAVADKIQAINAQESSLLGATKVSISNAEIQQVVKNYHDTKKSITTIVFSGHHDFSSFSGILGTVIKDDTAKAFKNYPDIAKGVKSGLGLGCYSATPAENEWWKKAFPSVSLVGGYDAAAPADTQPSNIAFLQDFLTKDKEIRKIGDDKKTEHDAKQIASMVHSLRGYTDMNTAVCTKDIFVGRNEGTYDITKASPLCTDKELENLKKGTDKMQALLADGSNPPPPANASPPCDGQKSWLRDYYNDLRSHQHCASALDENAVAFAPYVKKADSVIRLIDFETVYDNFKAYYKTKIARIASYKTSCKLPSLDLSSEISCVSDKPAPTKPHTMTRGQLLNYVAQLERSPCMSNPEVHTFWNEIALLTRDLTCVPLSWVNPVPLSKPVEKPTCNI